MSWSDPCSNCGQHRADCDCGNWNGNNGKKNEVTATVPISEEIQLPEEIQTRISQIDVPFMAYHRAMDLVMSNELPLLQRDHFRNGYYEGMKLGQQQGATITATHYAADNQRLVDLLCSVALSRWNFRTTLEEKKEVPFKDYWKQFCHEHNIK